MKKFNEEVMSAYNEIYEAKSPFKLITVAKLLKDKDMLLSNLRKINKLSKDYLNKYFYAYEFKGIETSGTEITGENVQDAVKVLSKSAKKIMKDKKLEDAVKSEARAQAAGNRNNNDYMIHFNEVYNIIFEADGLNGILNEDWYKMYLNFSDGESSSEQWIAHGGAIMTTTTINTVFKYGDKEYAFSDSSSDGYWSN